MYDSVGKLVSQAQMGMTFTLKASIDLEFPNRVIYSAHRRFIGPRCRLSRRRRQVVKQVPAGFSAGTPWVRQRRMSCRIGNLLDQPLPRRHSTEANRREQVHRFRVALFRFEKGGHGSTFLEQVHPSEQKRSSKPLLLIGWACPD